MPSRSGQVRPDSLEPIVTGDCWAIVRSHAPMRQPLALALLRQLLQDSLDLHVGHRTHATRPTALIEAVMGFLGAVPAAR
jgi:hypothetical protein